MGDESLFEEDAKVTSFQLASSSWDAAKLQDARVVYEYTSNQWGSAARAGYIRVYGAALTVRGVW